MCDEIERLKTFLEAVLGPATEIQVGDVTDDIFGRGYRIRTENSETLSLYVKCGASTAQVSFFQNELVFYSRALPLYRELAGDRVQFEPVPMCYGTQSCENSFIVMEDIKSKGYVALDKNRSVTFEEASLVVKQMAIFHGLSFVCKDQKPSEFRNIIKDLKEPLFSEDMRSSIGPMFVHAIHDALKLAKHSLPPGSVYLDRLSGFALNIYDKMTALATSAHDYRVLCHGDLWNGNVQVLYEGRVPRDARFLDVQGCRYSSPIHDLMFFLLVALDERPGDRLGRLISSYHSAVCDVVNALGSDSVRLFPASALQDQLREHARFALGMALVGLPLYLDEGTAAKDEESEAAHCARRAAAHKTTRCKNKMMGIIIDMVDYGFL